MANELLETGTEAAIPGTGFTKAHQLFRETVRRFVDQEINPYVDEWEEAEIFPAHDLFKKAGDLGLLGLSYPVEYSGSGGDYWYNMALAEELSRCNGGAIPMAMGHFKRAAPPAPSRLCPASFIFPFPSSVESQGGSKPQYTERNAAARRLNAPARSFYL